MAKSNKKEKSIWEHFGLGGNDVVDEGEQEKKPTVTIEDLQKQISELGSKYENERKRDLALMAAYIPPVEPVHKVQEVIEIDYDDLPDPSIDPIGYAKGVQKKTMEAVKAYNESVQASTRSQQSQNSKADKLWEDFRKTHEDYAKNEKRVEFATAQVIDDLKGRGIDANRYMLTNRDQFFTDITKQMDDIFGPPKAVGNKDLNSKGADQVDGNEIEDDDNEPEDRSVGIFGGLESGNAPSKKGNEQLGDMIKDLHDLQRKSGFF